MTLEREQIVAQLREKIGQGEAGGSGGQTSEEVDNEIGTYVRSMSVQDQLALLQELTGKSVDQIEIKKKEDD
uniref:DUF2312 domain-containing protein n=1 Tax=Meloidogyne hapla TaxID=6305 RepID=A0A1I8C0Z0_MELHA